MTRVFLTVSDHRHLVVAVGVLLVIAAVWCSVQQGEENSKVADDDGFVELDGYDAPSERSRSPAAAPEALALPPAPSEWPAAAPLDLGPAFVEAGLAPAAAPVNSAHFVSARDVAAPSPAWLIGTIETVDDVAQPFHESAIRYTRSVTRGESTQR